ncbi:MAG TPA: rod shape-determining protein MreC, partial [Tichowtungia sp.]|nr:rod shape-determining protein MreC [Tichowtungia sp.]
MVEQKKIGKWVAAAAVLLLILLLPDGVTRRIKGGFKRLITPIQSVVLRAGSSLKEGADTVRGFGGLAEENLRLKREVIRLQAESRLNKSIEEENLALRRMLKFHQRQARALIPAEVASRSISGWWQSVRLAKGIDDGVLRNRAVISPDGLVGRTADVSA